MTTPSQTTGTNNGTPLDRHRTFYAKEAIVEAVEREERRKPPCESDIVFGHFYANHMMSVDWSAEGGWSRPRVHALEHLSIHPAAKVLHYAIELFEGMKAYRGLDRKVRIFRPDMNMARMRRTAARAGLPDFDGEELTKLIAALIRLDEEWVPASLTSSLYIRPTLIATDGILGLGDPRRAKLFVLTCAARNNLTNFTPVTLLADPRFVRSFPGGVGAFKMGCNYAPTVSVGHAAQQRGCMQVLWIHGDDEELTEVGFMNIFVVWRNEQQEEVELATPPLEGGLILPGITRDTVLCLAREREEFRVSERRITMDDLRRALKEQRLLQVFGTGSSCGLSPVGRIVYHNSKTKTYEELDVPTMESVPNVMLTLNDLITDIQYGRIDRPHWMVEV